MLPAADDGRSPYSGKAAVMRYAIAGTHHLRPFVERPYNDISTIIDNKNNINKIKIYNYKIFKL